MANAIRFYQTGDADVLKLETVEVGDPGPGEARVRHTFVAVNFIDIYFRTGRYPLALPNGWAAMRSGWSKPLARVSRASRPATASAIWSVRKVPTRMCA